MKILVTTLITLGPVDLPEGVELVPFDETAPVPLVHRDAEAALIWGQSRDLPGFFRSLPRLRWIQALAAGPDKLLAADPPAGVLITVGVHFHDATVAEHALALLLTLVRRIPASLAAQRDRRWADELGGIRPLHPDGPITTLLGARVTIWGFGAIGQEIARHLEPFGTRITGIAHSAGQRDGFPVVDDASLPDVLPSTDVLVMVLPTRADTHHALDARIIDLLPDRALVVNVGRGSTVDEDAVAEALREGHLGAAALDVFEEEPLPPRSPLWDVPNLVITPHAAGGRPVGVEERLAHNVRVLMGGPGEMIGAVER